MSRRLVLHSNFATEEALSKADRAKVDAAPQNHAALVKAKAVHHAYSKHAEVTEPSLADLEKDWQDNPQRNAQRKLLPVDFRSPLVAITQAN